MTLDTWESLDRLARFSTVEQVAEDAGQTVEETQADLDVLVQAQRVRRKGRRARVAPLTGFMGSKRRWAPVLTDALDCDAPERVVLVDAGPPARPVRHRAAPARGDRPPRRTSTTTRSTCADTCDLLGGGSTHNS